MTKMMNNYHFYDTSALLEKANYLLTCEENIVTSTTVLEELENIKTSFKKDDNIKQTARKIIHFLNEFPTKIEIICFKDEMLNPIRKIKELAYKNNQQDIVDISDKFLSKFALFDKKS